MRRLLFHQVGQMFVSMKYSGLRLKTLPVRSAPDHHDPQPCNRASRGADPQLIANALDLQLEVLALLGEPRWDPHRLRVAVAKQAHGGHDIQQQMYTCIQAG
jgi:hypothetical protein